jgi:hypothetical protein
MQRRAQQKMGGGKTGFAGGFGSDSSAPSSYGGGAGSGSSGPSSSYVSAPTLASAAPAPTAAAASAASDAKKCVEHVRVVRFDGAIGMSQVLEGSIPSSLAND